MTYRMIALVALAGAVALGGCGKMGELERPGPAWNKSSSTSGADSAQRRAQDPDTAPDTIDPRDRTTDPAPPRTLPLVGTGQDPFAAPPQGSLPDPYNRPQ
jgi:hypothetical protein